MDELDDGYRIMDIFEDRIVKGRVRSTPSREHNCVLVHGFAIPRERVPQRCFGAMDDLEGVDEDGFGPHIGVVDIKRER